MTAVMQWLQSQLAGLPVALQPDGQGRVYMNGELCAPRTPEQMAVGVLRLLDGDPDGLPISVLSKELHVTTATLRPVLAEQLAAGLLTRVEGKKGQGYFRRAGA